MNERRKEDQEGGEFARGSVRDLGVLFSGYAGDQPKHLTKLCIIYLKMSSRL